MGSYVLEKGPAIRRAVLLAMVGLLPLLFIRGALDPFNVPKFAVLVVAVAVVVAVRAMELLQGADPGTLRKLWKPAAALLVPLSIAWLASPYKAFALFGRQGRLQGLIPYMIVVLLGVLLVDAFTSPRPIMWAVALASIGVSGYALIQYLQADPFGWVLDQGRTLSAVSTLGNPNFTGGFLGMALPVVVSLWVTTPKHRKPLGFLVIAMVGALVFTGSQGGWAAAAAGMCILGGFLIARRTPRARMLGYVAAALVAVATVGVVVAGQLGAPGIPATATARGNWWRAAGEMSTDAPVLGRGPSAFAVDGIRYRVREEAVSAGYRFPDDPHSVPLAFLVAAGAIGFLGFGFVIAWGTREGLSLGDDDLEGAAFFALVIAYVTQSLVSIDEVILRMSLWIGLAGLVIARSVPKAEKKADKKGVTTKNARKHRQPLRWAPAVIPLTALVILVGWWSWSYLRADIDMQRGLQAFRDNDAAAGRAHMEAALDFRWEPGYQRTYAGALSDLAAETESTESFEAADAAYAPFRDWPDVGAIVQHARLTAAWARIDPEHSDEVLPLYERALSIDDRNPDLLVEVANAYIVVEQPGKAVALLAPHRELIGQRMPQYWGMLSLALAQTGDEDSARAAADRALGLDPDNPAALKARDLLS